MIIWITLIIDYWKFFLECNINLIYLRNYTKISQSVGIFLMNVKVCGEQNSATAKEKRFFKIKQKFILEFPRS